MDLRQVLGLGLLGGAVWAFAKRSATTLPGTPQSGSTALFPGFSIPGLPADWISTAVARESGGDLAAKNPRSSASGKYQFTKATWLSLGGSWGSDPSKPFGGLAVSEAEQDMRFAKLSGSNAGGLKGAGLAVNNATLYAAHFLGIGTAIRVLTAPASASLASLVGSRVMAANPQLKGFTVGRFRQWLEGRK